MSTSEKLKELLRIIYDFKIYEFASLFNNNSICFDSPLSGRIGNNVIAKDFIKQASYWLKDESASFECINQVVTSGRIYTEYMIYRNYYGRHVDIPVAVMCDIINGKVSEMRIYHSSEYVVGHRVYRPAIMNPSNGNDIPEVNRRYFDAIKTLDMAEMRKIWADNGSVRGSIKCDFYFEGENLMTAFERFFAKGSVPLEHCTITQDDRNLIIEFALASWGKKHFMPQCGSAIYTVDGNGKLLHLRIYDDIVM